MTSGQHEHLHARNLAGAVDKQVMIQPNMPVQPKTYLTQAILVTLFLFWPLGVPAIVFAARVNSKWAQGDYHGAIESSRKAKKFSAWAAIVGGIIIILLVVSSGG